MIFREDIIHEPNSGFAPAILPTSQPIPVSGTHVYGRGPTGPSGISYPTATYVPVRRTAAGGGGGGGRDSPPPIGQGIETEEVELMGMVMDEVAQEVAQEVDEEMAMVMEMEMETVEKKTIRVKLLVIEDLLDHKALQVFKAQ